MIIQIYEIQTPQEAARCLELGVDHLGSVVLSPEQWRTASLKAVMKLTEGTTAKNCLIPLFGEAQTLFRVLDYYRPHYVHFCDRLVDSRGRQWNLDPFVALQSQLKDKFPEIGIIRSIPISEDETRVPLPTMPIARQLEPVSDLFLTDTWMANEPVAGFIGITGKTVDWNTASALVRQCKIPTILAGGLSPQNVYEALMTVLPAGVDSCTLTNRAGGDGTPVRFEKDFTKVARFVSEARRAGQAIRKRRLELTSELANLEALLAEHKAALPAHSVRPHQILAIEALEEEITSKTSELMHLKSWDT